MARHYLDYASTAPTRPQALAAMLEWFSEVRGDAGRIHAEGMAAREAIELAREQVASCFGARSREVVFTSCATEAIAMATWGAAERGAHQVFARVEHSAVRQSAEQHGDVTEVGVDRNGRLDPDELLSAVRPDTALVHVQWGNHEVGTRQPYAEVVAACRERGVLVHVDAAQAGGHDAIDFDSLGADLLSLSGHKLGAPPGTGVLLVRRGVRLRSLLVGSEQERARRAGLENGAGIVGLGAACETFALAADDELTSQRALTERVLAAVPAIDGMLVHGDPVDRLGHLVCLGFADVEPQAVLLGLDRAGVAVHSGSACSSESLEPSPVLEAMGVDAHRSLRVSVGWSSTDDDIDAFLTALPTVLHRLRALGGR
jgi:cysteine desulfurase